MGLFVAFRSALLLGRFCLLSSVTEEMRLVFWRHGTAIYILQPIYAVFVLALGGLWYYGFPYALLVGGLLLITSYNIHMEPGVRFYQRRVDAADRDVRGPEIVGRVIVYIFACLALEALRQFFNAESLFHLLWVFLGPALPDAVYLLFEKYTQPARFPTAS